MTDPSTPPDKIPVAELLEEYRRVVLATHDMTTAMVGLADSVDECSADTAAEVKALREDVRALCDRRPVADTARAVLETAAGKTIAVSAAAGALCALLSAIGLSPEVIGGILRAVAGGTQ